MMNNLENDLGYTGDGDKSLKCKKFSFKRFVKKVAEIESRNVDGEEPEYLEGKEGKFIIHSNILDIYAILKILLRTNLSGHTDTLTEASNPIDELYRRGEIQNEQEYRKAHKKTNTF